MAENFANDYATTLSSGIDASTTSLTVASATGAPAANFRLRIDNELLLVTNVSGTTFTVTRGVEGTTAASHSGAATVTHVLTAAGLVAAFVAPTGSDAQLSRQMFIDCGYAIVDKGSSGTSTQTLDYSAGSHQKITATGNHTIAFSNWPPSGNLGILLLEAVNFGAYTETWPTINWVKPDGTTTTSASTWLAACAPRTALQTSGTDFLRFICRDGGTTVYGGFAL